MKSKRVFFVAQLAFYTLDFLFFQVIFCGLYHGIHHHFSQLFGRIFVDFFQASLLCKSEILVNLFHGNSCEINSGLLSWEGNP